MSNHKIECVPPGWMYWPKLKCEGVLGDKSQNMMLLLAQEFCLNVAVLTNYGQSDVDWINPKPKWQARRTKGPSSHLQERWYCAEDIQAIRGERYKNPSHKWPHLARNKHLHYCDVSINPLVHPYHWKQTFERLCSPEVFLNSGQVVLSADEKCAGACE